MKQERFAKEYKVDGNGTKAAIRAGYSQKTAYAVASENLRKPEVKSAVESELESAKQKREKAIEETMNRVHTLALKEADPDSKFDYSHVLRAVDIDLKAMGVTDKGNTTNFQFNETKILAFLRACGEDV